MSLYPKWQSLPLHTRKVLVRETCAVTELPITGAQIAACCKSNILHADNCISVLYGDVFGAYSCFVDPTKDARSPEASSS